MLVRLNDTNEVNSDHVVLVTQPNANLPNEYVVMLSTARQVTTTADGVDLLRAAMMNWQGRKTVNLGSNVREGLGVGVGPDASPDLDDD